MSARSFLRVRPTVFLTVVLAIAILGIAGSNTPSSAASGCTPGSSNYSNAVLATSGIVGYWRLGEASGTVACDSTGANNGAYQPGTTLGRAGAIAGDPDTAVGFDGSIGWVQVPQASSLNVGDRFTIEAWVKRGTISSAANQVIAAKQSGAWVLMFNPANQLVLRKAGVADLVVSTQKVTDNSSWHHVVATKDGATVKLYLDGQDVTGTVTNQTMVDNSLPLAIGQSSTSAYFNGTIDEVALYNVALSTTVVSNHYNAGLPVPVAPANTAPPTISGTPQVGQSLNADPGTWSGTQPISFTYQWRRCDSGGLGCADIGGASGSGYTVVAADAGSTLRVFVTASNTGGSASASSAPTTTVTTTSGCTPRSSDYSNAVVATSGLIGYWRLGEASGTVACDSKGANPGTYQAGTTLGQPGALSNDPDTAVGFNGSSGWVQVPQAPSLNVGDRFTIEAWVKRGTVSSAANQVIAAKQSNAWVLMFNPANQLVLRKAGVADLVVSTQKVTDNSSWHHVVATKDGATVKLYLDGQDVTGAVTNQTMANNSLPLAIGQSSTSAYFNGTIDEVALYNVALSPSQVSAHFAGGTGTAPPANTAPPTISGTAQVGQTLNADPGTWTGTQPLSYAYQWRRCDMSGAGCADIAGATGSSYTVVAADAGSTLRVVVTASNSNGSASASSAAAAVTSGGCAPRSSSYSATVLGVSGLVGYWRLGEASGTVACDSTGTNNGTYQAGTMLGRAGAIVGDPDTAVGFDGSGGVQVPDAPSLDAGERFTIEAWVKRGAISSPENQVIASKQDGSWMLLFDPSNELVLRQAGVADIADSEITITDTGWHYVAATKDGATVTLYLDGQDVTGPVSNQTLTDNSLPLTIGQSSAGDYFTGTIDEVALYNVALSTTALGNHYYAGLPPPVAPANTILPTISGTAQAGQTLNADAGTWSGTQPLSYSYQWRRCDASGAGCTDIGGATDSSYAIVQADVGSTLRVFVTASNAGGSASTSSAATEAVGALCTTHSSNYSADILGMNGLVGYWRLGEASGSVACDTAGANNGTYQAGTTLGRAGAIAGEADTAVGFNGSNGWVQVPQAPALNVGDRFTIEAWVKRGTISSAANQVIAGKQSNAWVLMFNPANQLVLRKSGVADVAASTATVTDTSSWHYIVATKDGATVKLYLDGQDVTGAVTNQTMANNSLPLAIGQSSTSAYFNGTIDEVALYNVALTGAVVGAHYSAGVGSGQVIAAAGDIACDPTAAEFNGGLGTPTACQQRATSDLLAAPGLAAVLALGDNQYWCGGLSAYTQAYDPTWGRFKSITHPVPGNHEYEPSGGTDCDASQTAAGYFQYFGAAAGEPGKGYYSFDLGSWHLIALNSNCFAIGGCGVGSPEETWLQADLAAHPSTCTLAYWHHPRFTSGQANDLEVSAFWDDLYAAGVDVILNGHSHGYERFAPQDPGENYDPANGIREFVVGTGGEDLGVYSRTTPLTEVRAANTFGVLDLTLHASSYDWRFVPQQGGTFFDSGSTACH